MKVAFFFLVLGLVGNLRSVTGQTTGLLKVVEAVKHDNPRDVLVVFDIDETLTTYNSDLPKLSWENYSNVLQEFVSVHDQKNDKKLDLRSLYNLIEFYVPRCPVEGEDTIRALTLLKEKGFRTIALTASAWRGRCGNFIYEWRGKELQRLGIDLGKDFESMRSVILEDQTMGEVGFFSPPIGFSGRTSKARVLSMIMTVIELSLAWKPRKIVFIDNDWKHVENVDNWMTQLGYSVLSVLYNPPRQARPLTINKKLEFARIAYLVAHRVWLTDKELVEKKLMSPDELQAENIQGIFNMMSRLLHRCCWFQSNDS